MDELVLLATAVKMYLARVFAEASLVEIVTLSFLFFMYRMLEAEKKDRTSAYKIAFEANQQSINIMRDSIETTNKLATVIQLLRSDLEYEGRLPDGKDSDDSN